MAREERKREKTFQNKALTITRKHQHRDINKRRIDR